MQTSAHGIQRSLRVVVATILVTTLLVVRGAGDSNVAHATTGVGGTLFLGNATGAAFPVRTTAATDAYAGFNLHVRAVASGGVALGGMSGDSAGSTIVSGNDPSSVFCHGSVPVAGDYVFACTALNGQSTTTAGLLATLTVTASGNGCVSVRLVTVPSSDAAFATLNTYTSNAPIASAEMQANIVGSGLANVLVGSGAVSDCATSAAVGGIAEAPDLPDTTPTSHGARNLLDALAVSLAALVVACGFIWRVRRRRVH